MDQIDQSEPNGPEWIKVEWTYQMDLNELNELKCYINVPQQEQQ